MPQTNPYRQLPSVDDLVKDTHVPVSHRLLVEAAREALDEARVAIRDGREYDVPASFEERARGLVRSAGVPVINATGVLLHTNLGRAPWHPTAANAAFTAATEYTNVEIDLATGERSQRGAYLSRLLKSLTGAEDAMIVNNNASALLLAMSATSSGKAVPVARGELIEIGGSYRLPNVIEASGARLVEVGTTNRTRLEDYVTATQLHDCGSILKVHPSNYRIEGFTEEVDVDSLAQLAKRRRLPLIFDIGSGLLDQVTPWLDDRRPEWLRDEPGARQSIEHGADLVTFSGDKLLGGPQAGLIVGSEELIARLRANPLARALRVDGPTIAALTATLDFYARGEASELPFWQAALRDESHIEARARHMADVLKGETAPGRSTIGAGSVPGMTIPTTLVVLRDEDGLYRPLLAREEPILARREHGSLVIDLRTVDVDKDAAIIEAVVQCR